MAEARATIVSLPADDVTIVFRTERSRVHGRLIRLGPVTDTIIGRHQLPAQASHLLGEALALAGLLGSALSEHGSISIQTETDGLVPQIFAECAAPGKLRGYARSEATTSGSGHGAGLGRGRLAFTIDEGMGRDRYQGVQAVDGQALGEAALKYFSERENLPTFLRLAVAEQFVRAESSGGAGGDKTRSGHWRAGGLMLQPLGAARSGEAVDDDDGDDGWARVRYLAETVEDHELLDPTLTAERLLLRLFHEEGVIIEKTVAHSAYCKCSRDKIVAVLKSFGAGELSDLRDESGHIAVKCEFCAANYQVTLEELEAQDKSAD